MAFNFQQCDVPSPLAQLSDEGAYHSEVDYFLGAGVEVIMPPFLQDIQYNQSDQTVDKYQKVNMVSEAFPHIQQKLE